MADKVDMDKLTTLAGVAAKKLQEEPISFVKIFIGYKGGQLITHDVSDTDYSIDALSYTIDKKTQKVKGDEGEFLGFEPTGEYVLTIKVKYTKPQ